MYQFTNQDFEVVQFHEEIHSRLQIRPMYFEQGFSPTSKIFGRYAVLERLIRALNYLPEEFGLLIWDIYRPREVQRKLFDWMSGEIRKRSPGLTPQEHEREVLKYVAAPAKVGDSYCSPHLSGGAIDLTLFNCSRGEELNMGTVFDECSELAHRDYFSLKENLTPEENTIKERRNILREAMERVGFTSYTYEWWHFDLGNSAWGRVVQQQAVFGPLFGDAEWPPL